MFASLIFASSHTWSMTIEQESPELHEALKEGRATYTQFADKLQAADAKTQEELDKTFITLSTFLIGAVFTLRAQFASTNSSFGFPPILWIAIIVPLACILSIIRSHFLSLEIHRGIYDAIDKWDGTLESTKAIEAAHKGREAVRGNNKTSAVLFVIALIAAISFGIGGAHT
jgi:FtsH-binding integral membrane protein